MVAIAGIDTRRLTRILRDKGAQNGCIMAGESIDEDEALAMARGFPGLAGMDLAREVTTEASYAWSEGVYDLERMAYADGGDRFKVVAYDFGVKRNILRLLAGRGCAITVVPATHAGRGRAGHAARWRVPVQRTGRSGGLRLRGRGRAHAAGPQDAAVRHLPGPPDHGPGHRVQRP